MAQVVDITASPGVQATWNPLEPPSESSPGSLGKEVAIDILLITTLPPGTELPEHTHTHRQHFQADYWLLDIARFC